ncbi:UNVERIFIED_ORG: hypothetical protein FHR68_001124 [Xanthomonas campestris]
MAAIATSTPVGRRQRLLGWADRHFGFHSPRQIAAAVTAVVLLGALLSLGLGQDANWDLRNYHLYIGDAWAHDRLGVDLAPAQMQSYFSPLLDVLHAWLMLQLPGPVAGLLLGGLHALVFVPVAAVAWRVLAGQTRRAQWAPLLAVAGMCSAVFLSELGGTMGDTASAIPVLAALALVLSAQARARQGAHAVHRWAIAGALIGLAVSLKLTNALYALALVPAVLCDGGRLRSRVLGLGVLSGVAALVLVLVAGPWYWQVWQHLGNPLFPQFNGVFKSPLAQPVSIADVRWLPRNLGEQLIWPLLFTFKPQRIGDLGLVQAGWAVLYAVTLVAAGRGLLRRPVRRVGLDRSAVVLLVFFGVAYALWQVIFSIHRYLVVLELLAPLVLWIVSRHAFATYADRKAAWLIGLCALVAVVGWKDWGHEAWARDSFQVQQPAMGEPAASTVAGRRRAAILAGAAASAAGALYRCGDEYRRDRPVPAARAHADCRAAAALRRAGRGARQAAAADRPDESLGAATGLERATAMHAPTLVDRARTACRTGCIAAGPLRAQHCPGQGAGHRRRRPCRARGRAAAPGRVRADAGPCALPHAVLACGAG